MVLDAILVCPVSLISGWLCSFWHTLVYTACYLCMLSYRLLCYPMLYAGETHTLWEAYADKCCVDSAYCINLAGM